MTGPTVCFPNEHGLRKYQGYIDFTGNYLGFMSCWFCWIIVVLKLNRDNINGISKLDHIVKISAFQKYKSYSGSNTTRETLLTNDPSKSDGNSAKFNQSVSSH